MKFPTKKYLNIKTFSNDYFNNLTKSTKLIDLNSLDKICQIIEKNSLNLITYEFTIIKHMILTYHPKLKCYNDLYRSIIKLRYKNTNYILIINYEDQKNRKERFLVQCPNIKKIDNDKYFIYINEFYKKYISPLNKYISLHETIKIIEEFYNIFIKN